MMTLTQAIEKVLLDAGAALDAKKIADRINKTKLYVRNDGTPLKPGTVLSRVENNPNNFFMDDEMIFLEEWRDIFEEDPDAMLNEIQTFTDLNAVNDENMELKLKVLMNEKNFKSISEVRESAPKSKGIVCIRIKNLKGFPKDFTRVIKDRGHNIILIEMKDDLAEFFNTDCAPLGEKFRQLGTLMGHKPPKGSLVDTGSKTDYPFSDKDHTKIGNWFNNALIYNYVDIGGDMKPHFKELTETHRPLLADIPNNKETNDILKEWIKEAAKIANTKRKK